MTGRFDGKVALVTGGGSGLGGAIGRRLAAEGARVVLADRDSVAAAEVASACDGRGEALTVDVRDTPSVEAMVAAVRDRHNHIDVLVNSAGRGQRPSGFEAVVDDDLDELLAVNVKSVYVVTRAALPLLTAASGSVVVNLASSTGLRPRPGYAAYAAEAARTERESSLIRLAIIGFLVLLALILVALLAGYLIYGREHRPDYDREYEQEPPSELEPAIVNALINQGRVDEQAFTAVLFDLIRRDLLTARPVSVEKKTWLGLRSETITDLEIVLGSLGTGLTAPEARVRTILKRVLAEGPEPLSEFRTKLREDAAANHESFVAFQSASYDALARAGLLEEGGKRYPFIVLGALAAVLLFTWVVIGPWAGRKGTSLNKDMVRTGVIVVGVLGTILILAFSRGRRIWVRLSPEGALMAARWRAFRRYLSDFSLIEEAPPISIALWEEFLVYGITLGVAEDVLAAARFAAPAELVTTSHVYWYGSQGDFGGHSTNAIEGISRALTGAFAAPSSSGGGGGFSGGRRRRQRWRRRRRLVGAAQLAGFALGALYGTRHR